MSKIRGIAMIFGIDAKWVNAPIVNLPENAVKVRRRFRPNDAARAFVKTADGFVHHFVLVPTAGTHKSETMELGPCQGVNQVHLS